MKRKHLSLAIAVVLNLSTVAYANDVADVTAAADPQATAATPAATNAPGNEARLDTITVTARRREESAQKVPVSVSAFGQEDLAELQAHTVDNLQGAVPNLNIVEGRGSSSAVNAFIRGIGQPDALQTFDPGVGIYVDDVYYSRIQGALFNMFDVSQVEVLRGPQGTLYGKNSTGGAIKIETREPGDHSEASVGVTIGNHGRIETQFYGATPLSNTVSASIAATTSDNNGYVRDNAGNKYNDDGTQSIRGKIVWHPSDTFKGIFSLDYTHQNNALTLGTPEAPLIQIDLATGARVLLTPSRGEYDFRSNTSFNPNQGQKLIHKGASAAFAWELSPSWTLKSITAYRKLDTAAFIDIDASQYQLGDVFVSLKHSQLSQEFQAQYDNGSNFHATYGLYYLNEKVPSTQYAFASDLFTLAKAPIGFRRSINDDLDTKSYAAFAQANWEFVPTWTLTGGLRYTDDSKDYYRTTSTFWTAPLTSLNGTFAFNTAKSFDAWTPSLSLQKAFTDHVMGYISANRGFKSGGFNGRANSASEESTYNPEYVWTYEAGFKTSSDDGKLLGNIAVFHSDYRDFQARVSEITNPAAPVPTFAFPVLNAAKLSMDGIEFEGVALIGDGNRLSTQIGYLNAKYDEFDDPRTALTPALAHLHDHVPFAPKVTARVAASHTFSLGNSGGLTFGGDVSYRDTTWLSVDNRDALSQKAYTLVGLYGIYDSADQHWQIQAGVRNLTNKVYKTDAQEFSSVGNIQTAYFGLPRNYYVTARYNF